MKSFVFPSLCIIVSLSFLISCGDDPVSPNEENVISDEAYKAIGCGYDVFGNYADPTQIKGRVVEAYNLPEEYNVRTQINHSVFSTESGSSIQEYQERLAAGLEISGNFRAFSGAVKTNFTQDYYSINQTSFATVMGKINSYQIAIAPNYARVSMLRPYLADQAATDLNDSNVSPQEIFRMYGTHVVTGAVMGARLDFNIAMRSSDIETGKTMQIYAEAEYSSLFGHIETSASFGSEQERRDYEAHRSKTVNAIGGKSEYAQSILTRSDYDRWIDSISGNEVFCDYTENGMIPVWEFCDDETRKNALISEYDTWAADRQIVTHDAPPPPENCIIDIQVKNSDNGDSYHANGLTYYKINQDLNEGSGGKLIYLYAAIGLDNSTNPAPVTGMALVHGNSSSCRNSAPANYSVINVDLNEGAGGEFIYLCISRNENAGEPIRRIEVWDKSDKDAVYSYNADGSGAYYDVYVPAGPTPLDINRGAGGDFIYILYSRTN